MMKRNRLYTVNSWNKPAFMYGSSMNMFPDGGSLASYGYALKTPETISINAPSPASSGGGGIAGTLGGLVGGGGSIGGALKGAVGAMGGISGIGSAVGGAIGGLIGNGYQSGVGNALGAVGKMASVIPGPWGAAISGGLQVLGGGVNALFGSKVDAVRLGEANKEMSALNSFKSNATSFDDIKGATATKSVADIYKGGALNKSAAKDQAALEERMAAARQFADRSIGNNIYNLADDQTNQALANYSAFGGGLDIMGDNDMGAVNYGFMTDYLNEKKRQNDLKNKMGGISQMPAFMSNGYAEGGKFGGGSFYGSGAGGSWDETSADTYNVDNFNQAFDMAVADGLKEFIFQGRRYNTQKENNPIREYNNRWVGQGRRTNKKNPSKAYDHQAGPLGGPLADIPMVVDTHVGTPERPPQLEYDPNAMERGKALPYSWSNTVDRVKRIKPMNAFGGPLFALGGVLQSHGGDWSDGLMHINAGGTHEENKYEGIQLGRDENLVPNLVEEGETVYNDYVFSNRITCDADTKKKFHIGKNRDITYAELSKKLEKEISERPNDPISKSAFEAQMASLAENQERQKAEMEAARAREAFEALTPEEQTALMQQMAEQKAAEMASQPTEEEMMTQQAAVGQPTPEEMAMAQGQQMMQADGSEAALGQAPQMACGGKINRFDKGGKKNVGNWKDKSQNHWDVFTKPGLEKYLRNLEDRIKMAPDDETKDAIRREAMNDLNALQQSYFSHVLPTVGSDQYTYSDDILNHQKRFDRMYGNTGFYTTDDNGNVTNLIADAINLPKGAATDDKPNNWFDGYSGPRTSIRNFGSTEYGDDKYYQELVDRFGKLGLTYAPNENWKYGENQLYGLSIAEPPTEDNRSPQVWDWNTGSWIDKPADSVANENPGGSGANGAAGNGTGSGKAGDGREVVPIHRNEKLRYAGLFGPAIGLGMQMIGIGKPDTSGIEAAANAGNGPAHLASYQPIGDYMAPKVFDRLFYANQLQANARATDRNLMNTSGGNRGTAMAGLLANGYNTNNNLGNLYRQAEEYNDNRYKQMKEFNRGTNMFNAEAYNKTSQFNADALNRQRQYGAQLAMQAAREKMDADAGWYNGIYGNISGLMKGIGDLGRENAQRNMIADMAANGIFGQMTPSTYVANGMLRYETDEERAKRLANQKKSAAKGGKIKRKKRGLTY